VEFGLFYEIPVPRPWHERSELVAYQQCLEAAILADRVGFESFWTVEHHFLEEFSHCSAPGVLYGAVAARTERIRIGHGVRLLPFPYNHPIRAAEAAAVVDLVSNGRLEFGTGRSATRIELEAFGIHPDDTRSMWEEALRVVVGAWTEDEFAWEGKHFRFPRRRVVPKPIQRPHPPLWAATTSPPSHELVGRLGLGLLSFTIGVPPEDLAQRIALYRRGIAAAKPVGRFVNPRAATFTMVHCADSTAAAVDAAREAFAWYAQTGVRQIQTLGQWQQELAQNYATYDYTKAIADMDPGFLTFDYLDKIGACLVGDPDRIIATARRYEAAGCDLLLCLMQPHAIPHERVLRSIELVGRHVIPEFRSKGRSGASPGAAGAS
jgi:alkanesulfonate monooxygenase SsuD/methylene tetrahydromethanopterin reductase-like flavin-dependent oxidoreductase (luciferase family)